MLSPVVVTFIHRKGRSRWISRLEAYACKHGYTDVALAVSEPVTYRFVKTCLLLISIYPPEVMKLDLAKI